jgi:Alpha/beta hydrolase domain
MRSPGPHRRARARVKGAVSRRLARRIGLTGLLAAVGTVPLVVAATAPTASSLVATNVPSVTGPIPSTTPPGDPSHDYVFYATPMDLKKVGYTEEEFFISGIAKRFTTTNPVADSPIGEMPYTTRIVVRRPVNPRQFSGVVVVDWQNVTAGHDIDTEWGGPGGFFVRHGWIWVGASVQRVGVNGATSGATAGLGLRQWNPDRYGSLDLTNGGAVTDDSQSYDVYTQIARLLKQGPSSGPDPLAGFDVERVYAGGVSQSATFLVRYYNGLQADANVYDGFLIGLGGGTLRLDVPTKAFKVYTENDVWRGQGLFRVPDTDTTHTWEIAGASHVPAAAVSLDPTDFRATLGAIPRREYGPSAPRQCVNPGPSDVEVWAVFQAAYAALDLWVTQGVEPATAPLIEATSLTSPAAIVRDENGLALGGLRLPKVTVPVAVVNGENAPANLTNPLNAFCVLYGTLEPFDQQKLDELYPTHGSYVSQVTKAVNDLVADRLLLREDARTLLTDATQSSYGK